MEYTIRNALGKEPDAWRDGKLLAKINLTIPLEYEPYADSFWPWRARELEDLVHAVPNVRYYIAAYDHYHNGKFMYTRYYARMIIQPSAPCRVLPPLKLVRVENGRKPIQVECLWQKITPAKDGSRVIGTG